MRERISSVRYQGMKTESKALRTWAGITDIHVTHAEKWLSAIGGMLGILCIVSISQAQLGLAGSTSIIASMGATAVLLFAVPQGPLSQPWPVFGGHVVSAIIGVACSQWIPLPALAAAVAVAVAITSMHYLRCIHPPGGATALSAVVGGDAVHQLGFQFVLTPVALNAMTILAVAFVFNAPFVWRRYPVAWAPNGNTRKLGGNQVVDEPMTEAKDE